ncbi:S-adenosyl-L-methionine-dependent methyltransferase [Hyaloscypha variabilis]|uniref:S-adenosyl-L-methionine-dependent methyltransferase n=1 Tax=Hyaloscypha variabilis (strain UAMH 11265 / GT02V1 / F) TaxID=1149755 RepID=A0A2J6RD29_HYAVF|nr:S-adenosyl-L-methionine-dependent methyltransferase [Hyaloscypha variabilis F]
MAAHVQPLADDPDYEENYQDDVTSTASLSSSILAYEVEHGRSYHAYNAGKYVLPNDEEEKDRMDIQYHALRILFEEKLFYAPIDKNPQCILDIGTGTGIWVMDVGDEYVSAKVIGTDLSPIQPRFVPPNVQFEIHDCTEYPWTFPENSIDLVHTRITNGFAVRDWKAFYDESYKTIKPGGWIESQEFDLMAFSDDKTLPSDSAVVKWCKLMNEGGLKAGFDLRLTSETLRAAMEEAGFKEITVLEFKLPIGLWPADPRLREAGKFGLAAMLQGLQGISLATFTRLLGWQVEEMEVLLAQVRSEWRRRRVHSYWPIFVVYGRKPLSE